MKERKLRNIQAPVKIIGKESERFKNPAIRYLAAIKRRRTPKPAPPSNR